MPEPTEVVLIVLDFCSCFVILIEVSEGCKIKKKKRCKIARINRFKGARFCAFIGPILLVEPLSRREMLDILKCSNVLEFLTCCQTAF